MIKWNYDLAKWAEIIVSYHKMLTNIHIVVRNLHAHAPNNNIIIIIIIMMQMNVFSIRRTHRTKGKLCNERGKYKYPLDMNMNVVRIAYIPKMQKKNRCADSDV